MLMFFPPIVQILGGVVLLGAGVAVHIVILDAVGALSLVIGSFRWLRKRRDAGAGQ
jgi:hypothetical protein